MREVILNTNNSFKSELSNDLGAIAGMLFEIGSQKIVLGSDEYLSEDERKKMEKLIVSRQAEIRQDEKEDCLHTEMQYHLLKIGHALGYDVFSSSNDKSKSFNGNNFSFLCFNQFPEFKTEKETLSTIKLIDVLWFQKGTNNVLCAFEVEKSTSIYSGILRLTDLSYTVSDGDETFYLVVPDAREKDVMVQLARPSIKKINIPLKYILFSELQNNCDALCKFGDSHTIMEKIAKMI